MRHLRFSHAVLGVFLWCAAAFAFTGICFSAYDKAAVSLRESRIRALLSEVRKTLQIKMDKGEGLSALKGGAEILVPYQATDGDILSISVFDFSTGKILFGTDAARTGNTVYARWYEKCGPADDMFVDKEESGDAYGVPIVNAFGEKAGCAVIEYKAEEYEDVRQRMMETAVGRAGAFCIGGVLFVLIFYILHILPSYRKLSFMNKATYRKSAFVLLFICAAAAIPIAGNSTFRAFEDVLKSEISSKTKVIAGIISSRVSLAIKNGMPFKSLHFVETYLDTVRQENPEILFILLTDKSGRVLYESGSAVQAFESDASTGKVSLREGFLNTAEPVRFGAKTEGWVQIGVMERFVRDKIF